MWFKNFFAKKKDDEEEEIIPGLVREHNMIELIGSGVSVYDSVYVPVKINIFEDKWVFIFNKFEGDDSADFTEYSLEVPGTPHQETVTITLDGVEFVWDDYDGFFRWNPFEEAVPERKFNDYVEYFSNGELRIQKDYAEHNLSPEALECAWNKCDEYYSFNVHDGTYAPVLFEMPSLFDKKEKFQASRFKYFQAEKGSVVGVLLCVQRYLDKKFPDKSVPSLYLVYEQNEKRELWNG